MARRTARTPRASRRGLTPDEMAQRELAAELEDAKRILAAELGPAPGVKMLSDHEEARMYGVRDPLADYEALVQTLTSTGITDPQMLDPKNPRGLAIARLSPELIPFYGQVVPPEVAHQLAAFAVYPQRHGLLRDMPADEMVEKANRLDMRWQQQFRLPSRTGPTPPPVVNPAVTPPEPYAQPAPLPELVQPPLATGMPDVPVQAPPVPPEPLLAGQAAPLGAPPALPAAPPPPAPPLTPPAPVMSGTAPRLSGPPLPLGG